MSVTGFIGRLLSRRTAVPKQDVKPKVYGTRGRLEIPALSISVPLYHAYGSDKQRIVDDVNSAAFFRLGVQDVIADHANQANFHNLNQARPGMTATINSGTGSAVYRLIQTQVGHIRTSPEGNRLLDQNWNQVAFQNEGGLCIYTCMGKSADDVMDVRLTYWRPAELE